MITEKSFSQRNNFEIVNHIEITIRNEAPDSLRELLISFGNSPITYMNSIEQFRSIVTKELQVSNNPNNWSYSNIYSEILYHLKECEWYKIYNIIEKIYNLVKTSEKKTFSEEINNHFINNGIGWKLENGKVVYRGDQSFEAITKETVLQLSIPETERSLNEFKEAFLDLSRKPKPDLTGAAIRAFNGLECMVNKIDEKEMTFGKLIKGNKNIPPPLNLGVEKLWSFATETARHAKEGGNLTVIETELLVSVSAAVATYLHKLKFGNTIIVNFSNFDGDEDPPF